MCSACCVAVRSIAAHGSDESYVDEDLDVVPQPKKRKMQQKQTRRLKVSIVHRMKIIEKNEMIEKN
jgi:hypothetical protein